MSQGIKYENKVLIFVLSLSSLLHTHCLKCEELFHATTLIHPKTYYILNFNLCTSRKIQN